MQVHPALESRASEKSLTSDWPPEHEVSSCFGPVSIHHPSFFRDRRLQVYTVFGSSLSQETEEYCTMVLESNCFRRYCYQSFSWASFTAKRGGTFASMASSCKLRAKILISCYLWQCVIVSHSVSLGLMFFYAVTVVHRPDMRNNWNTKELYIYIWVVIHALEKVEMIYRTQIVSNQCQIAKYVRIRLSGWRSVILGDPNFAPKNPSPFCACTPKVLKLRPHVFPESGTTQLWNQPQNEHEYLL